MTCGYAAQMRWDPAAEPGRTTTTTANAPERSPAARRRDRRGHGLRGPLAPAAVPLARSRAERFNELVLDAVEALERRWRDELAAVQFAVEDVPPVPPDNAAEPVSLARLDRVGGGHRIVVHRWPIEVRVRDHGELGALVHDVVVEEVAELLGVEPEAVDPDYDGGPAL